MDERNQTNDDDDEFFDTLDDFPSYDCISTDQSDQSTSEYKETTSTLRRRSIPNRRTDINNSGEKRYKLSRNQREKETNLIKSEPIMKDRDVSVHLGSGVSEEKEEESTVTTENEERVVDSLVSEAESPQPSSLLDWTVGLVIKAIGFQVNLLIGFILLPFNVIYYSFMLITNPFGTVNRGKDYLLQKLYNFWNLIWGFVSPLIHDWFKGHESIWKFVSRFGWGLFWAIFVCSILCGLLIFSILTSGILMRFLVEKPIQIRETLNFDYTKNRPVAFVPVMSCDCAFSGVNCKEKKELPWGLGPRVIPIGHKLQVTVKLTLPESDYNRRLGIFQVRVEFLSGNGETLSSSSHRTMLKFKSEPVRHLLTFFKVASIVVGYVSETQTLNVKFRGFVERDVPTSCLKVMIEQRAEFQPGAGIPELYDTPLILESELPLFKRIIWYWKRTIFVWITMTLFMTQLFFALICCRPLILPRPRRREDPASSSTTPGSLPSQTESRPRPQQT
ncbi:hypothetical protein CISIN_1g010745mg [Citrus sinensis]|uniref:Seipin n=1 Tax=Citrus sinensis TaxID=2711 RepID=A0A067GE12_CITSI|nr:hypothetical protein CISIN_1g010745mg [Citrus sinensis]